VPARPSRWVADRSGDGRTGPEPRFAIEAVRVFDRLKALGGSGRLSDVYEGFNGILRGFVRDGVADLERLGLVSRRPGRMPGQQDVVLVLSPGWEDLGLTSGWSRATW
jgi:hypothetical protein